jgi:aminoglycoside 3-N-acetyltransferase I
MKNMIRVKLLSPNDLIYFQKLIALFNEVFKEADNIMPNEMYLQGFLAKPGFTVFAALAEDEVIGGLTAFELPLYYIESSEMFIYDVAIKPAFQRQGIGKKLLSALKEYCTEKSIKEIFVAANKEDVHALDFYRSMCAEEEEVIHFNYLLNTKN